jgi:hypothetical protein
MNFSKAISNITNRYGGSQVFDDFLQMAVCAYSMGKSEDLYFEVIKKYNPEELKGFGQALGALVLDHEKQNRISWTDFLGRHFEDAGLSNARTGQFFTPESICKLMAQITYSGIEGETVNDCACGSSRTLIAHANLDPKNRMKYFYIGQDLDRRACLMSVLNFVMFGMKGVIINMNALTLEIYGGWRVYMPETLLGVQPLSVQNCMDYLFTKKETEIKEEKTTITGQLNLF